MTVTVSDNYVVGCADCCAEVERITRAAIRDFSVTKLTFTPGHRHNHIVETPEKQENRGLVAATAPTNPPPLGDQETLFIDAQSGSLNGFDHAKEA